MGLKGAGKRPLWREGTREYGKQVRVDVQVSMLVYSNNTRENPANIVQIFISVRVVLEHPTAIWTLRKNANEQCCGAFETRTFLAYKRLIEDAVVASVSLLPGACAKQLFLQSDSRLGVFGCWDFSERLQNLKGPMGRGDRHASTAQSN